MGDANKWAAWDPHRYKANTSFCSPDKRLDIVGSWPTAARSLTSLASHTRSSIHPNFEKTGFKTAQIQDAIEVMRGTFYYTLCLLAVASLGLSVVAQDLATGKSGSRAPLVVELTGKHQSLFPAACTIVSWDVASCAPCTSHADANFDNMTRSGGAWMIDFYATWCASMIHPRPITVFITHTSAIPCY